MGNKEVGIRLFLIKKKLYIDRDDLLIKYKAYFKQTIENIRAE